MRVDESLTKKGLNTKTSGTNTKIKYLEHIKYYKNYSGIDVSNLNNNNTILNNAFKQKHNTW